jgi:hypothetical protein
MKTILTVFCCFSALTFAQELKPAQEEAKGQFETRIASSLKSMNEKCGTAVQIKTDFENFQADDWKGTSFGAYCAAVTDAMAQTCASRPAYKKGLAKRLTGVSCLFGGVQKAEPKDSANAKTLRNMSFENGVFVYRMSKSISGGNIAGNTQTVLAKTLNE